MDNPYKHLPPVTGHPANLHVYQFFAQSCMVSPLDIVFSDLAAELIDRAPLSPETTVALRHLLQAKEATARAVLDQEREQAESVEIPDDPITARDLAAEAEPRGQV